MHSSSCTQTVQTPQHDRPNDRVVARRRGAQRPNSAALANPSPHGSQCDSPARPNGAAISLGSLGKYDSMHVCTQQMYGMQHGRPRASGVARPWDLDVHNRADAVYPLVHDTCDGAAAAARNAVSSEGSWIHHEGQHQAQRLATVRPPARVGARARAPRRVPTATSTLSRAYAVLALHPSITGTLPMADEPVLLPSPLCTSTYGGQRKHHEEPPTATTLTQRRRPTAQRKPRAKRKRSRPSQADTAASVEGVMGSRERTFWEPCAGPGFLGSRVTVGVVCSCVRSGSTGIFSPVTFSREAPVTRRLLLIS